MHLGLFLVLLAAELNRTGGCLVGEYLPEGRSKDAEAHGSFEIRLVKAGKHHVSAVSLQLRVEELTGLAIVSCLGIGDAPLTTGIVGPFIEHCHPIFPQTQQIFVKKQEAFF